MSNDAKELSALQQAAAMEPAPDRQELADPPIPEELPDADQKELPKPADVIPIERGLMRKAIEEKNVQPSGVIPFPSQIKGPLEAKNVLLEQTKPLRMELQSRYQGTLTYSGKLLDNGNVEFMLEVELSQDPEEKFSMELTPKDLASSDSLYKMLLEKVVSYVFKYEDVKPREEQHGLQAGDLVRIEEMAQDIIKTFTGEPVRP